MPDTPVPTVTVVDDDPDSLWLAAVVLTGAGVRVLTDDGSPGLAARLAGDPPDVILLDLHLEARDADEAIREIRGQERLRSTPILGFTGARSGDPLLERVRPALAGRVRKPLDPTELTTAVRRALGEPARSGGTPAPRDPAIDSLRDRFIAGLAGRVERIEAAAAASERNTLILEVHRLRGAAGGYGFGDLAGAAEAAEQALREDAIDAAEAVARLITAARSRIP